MARVKVDIEEVDDIEGEDGRPRVGVRATCSGCDHVTESFGVGPKSRARCLVLLREECPNNEENFYVDADDDGRLPDPVVRPWWDRS